MWDCDFPEAKLEGWAVRKGEKNRRQENVRQENRIGGQDVFYFPVRHFYFPVDGAIRRGLRLLTRAVLLLLRVLSRVIIIRLWRPEAVA
ncbi:MAG: hypothetical protein ACREAB_14495 [Blastocatellia bacterium]